MTCYNCQTSNETTTKTITTTCYSPMPNADCAKSGHGHARITYLDE